LALDGFGGHSIHTMIQLLKLLTCNFLSHLGCPKVDMSAHKVQQSMGWAKATITKRNKMLLAVSGYCLVETYTLILLVPNIYYY
jgi:hypothetical protein